MNSKPHIFLTLLLSASFTLAEDEQSFTTVPPSSVVCSAEGDSATVLEDHSIQFGLGKISFAPEIHFTFPKEISLSEIRLEVLPDTRFKDRRLHRGPGDELIVFGLTASVKKPDVPPKTLEFGDARNPDDEDDATAPHVIDFLSDTGWKVGSLKIGTSATTVICTFDKPAKVPAGEAFILTLDTGGSPELAAPARIRIGFR